MFGSHPDWPHNIEKPELPEGYEWCCLRPAYGIGEMPNHPWWVRVVFKTKNNHIRHLKITGEYFDTPQEAIDFAVKAANEHARKAGTP